MASEDGVIIIGIELDDGTLKKAQVKADDLSDAISKGFSGKISGGIDKSFTGIAIQLQAIQKIASASFGAISGIIGKAIDEASSAETAFNSLQIALGNIGADPKTADNIASLASELQRLGTVSDDAVVSAAQSLVSIGNLSGPALEQATKSSVDLAAGLGIDLNTAFDLVAKSAAGNTAALSRYGIKIDETIPKGERFQAVLDLVNQRFGGFDAAKANTFGGAITKLGIAFNDIFENLGKFFTQDKTLVAVLNFITSSFNKIAESIGKAFDGNKNIVGDFIKRIISVAISINEIVGPAFDAFKNIAFVTFDAIGTGLRTILTGFGAVGLAVNKILNSVGIVSDETLQKSQAFFDEQSSALIDSASQTANTIKEEFSGNLPLSDSINEFLLSLNNAAVLAPELGASIRDGIAPPLLQVRDLGLSLTDAFKTFKDGFFSAADEIAKKSKETFQQAGAQALRGFGSAAGSAFSAVGAAIAKGQNAFDAFGRAFLNAIGQVAVQLGTTFILEGTAYLFSANPALSAKGPGLVAAGAALATFGGLLSGIGGGAASGSGAGSPAGTGAGITTPVTSEQPDLASRDRRPEVTIQVQGNVLDRRESGLEIARVLQEFFDTNDGVLARAT